MTLLAPHQQRLALQRLARPRPHPARLEVAIGEFAAPRAPFVATPPPLVVAQSQVQEAPAVVRLRILRIESERAIERVERFLHAAFFLQGHGEVGVAGRLARIELDGAPLALDGFSHAAEAPVAKAEVAVEFRDVGAQRDGSFDVRRAGPRVAALKCQDADAVHRRGVLRLALERVPIERFGFSQSPGPVMPRRPLDEDVGRIGGPGRGFPEWGGSGRAAALLESLAASARTRGVAARRYGEAHADGRSAPAREETVNRRA